MQVWHAIGLRYRCDSLGFQVHPRFVNFDLRTVGYSYQLCLIHKLQKLLTLNSFFYICAFVFVILLSNVCEFGLLHTYDYFVNLNFLLVILDIFRVMHET